MMVGKSLYCWYLADPAAPKLVGEVRLEADARSCILIADPSWVKAGFDLAPDMPAFRRLHAPYPPLKLPVALDDAMPDRWGERMIRVLARPTRMSPLDLLWYAGDRRFGALGISSSPDTYTPHDEPPLISSSSISEAEEIIHRVMLREPLSEAEKQMIASAGSLGGAHPKMLVEHEGAEWIAKFPKGNNVDQLLIEHGSMELARRAGLSVADSMVLPGGIDHILLVKRFDREGGLRRHAISAHSMLIREGDESYASIAGMIRKHGDPDRISDQQEDLFRRMAFNIMIDNTDDHTRNHAFLMSDAGTWSLSPAYDIPPQMNGLGVQAIQISPAPFKFNDFTREHAVSAAASFGMTKERAEICWNEVAGHVAEWKEVFSGVGISEADIDYLADFLDSESMLNHRRDAIPPPAPRQIGIGR